MLKGWTSILSTFIIVTFLNMVVAYRSHYYNSPVSYSQPRQNWDRSDEIGSEANNKFSYNGDLNRQSQIKTRTPDWNPTADFDSEEESEYSNDYQFVPKRFPTGLQQNIRSQLHPLPEQTQYSHYTSLPRQPEPQGSSLNARKYDEPFDFKVQRNPEGKLSIRFNSTAARPQDDIQIGNRNQQPIPPFSILQPSRGKRDIVFPDDGKPRPRITPDCAKSGKTFCLEVENYPQQVLEGVLNEKYDQLFDEDILPDISPNITERIGAPEEESLCLSTTNIIYPQAGLSKDNNWSFIVNQPNYKQGVRIEECVSPGKPCAMTDNFPNTYTTECKQKHIYRHLVSIDDEKKVVKNLYQFPSCCTCVLKAVTRSKRGAPQCSKK